MAHTVEPVADNDDLTEVPIERRRRDRRRRNIPVANDRRKADRRASRLEPTQPFAGVAIVVDGWPLLRAGVRQMLTDASFRVAADEHSVIPAAGAVGDRLDLAILGVTKEPLGEAVRRVRALPGPEDEPPSILVLLDRVDIEQLRALLADGVEGILDRTVNLPDMLAACERVLAGHRVLAGGPLSVLASAGLELTDELEDDDEQQSQALLTRKELEVLAELGRHLSNREIAESMHVSAATVKTHLSNIYAKLGVGGRREAVVAAVERGLLT